MADLAEVAEAEALAAAEAVASAAVAEEASAEAALAADFTEGRAPRIIITIITAGDGAFTVRTGIIIMAAADASAAFLG